MLLSHGVEWGCCNLPSTTLPGPCTRCRCYVGVGMLTFLWPRSLGLAQDVDATLKLGGVGWGMLHQWGGVGWGDDNAHTTLRKMLMLRPRWSNYHGSRLGFLAAIARILLGLLVLTRLLELRILQRFVRILFELLVRPKVLEQCIWNQFPLIILLEDDDDHTNELLMMMMIMVMVMVVMMMMIPSNSSRSGATGGSWSYNYY